jgi:hypothetical protein
VCLPLAFFEVPALLQYAFAAGSTRENRILGFDHELSLMQAIGRTMTEKLRMAERLKDAEALRNTMSWRITAPLRRLKSIILRSK